MILQSQHGFRCRRSCLTNILEFLEDITNSVDCQKGVDVIFLDFQKAFDKVPHCRLLVKLRSLGITGSVLAWIHTWLTDRKQRVVLKGCRSSWCNVASGVPQGSVLGPLLFISYINDIDASVLSNVLKFADDTKLYREVSSCDDATMLQADLNNVFDWSQLWQMPFNVSKCKIMHIGSKNPCIPMSLNGTELTTVSVEKDLGFYLDSSLKPSRQCVEAAKKGNRVLGMIRRNFKFLHRDTVLRLYKQLVRPHLEYAVQAWNPCYSKDSDVLEKVQRRATRLIGTLNRVSYPERLRVLSLSTLKLRRQRGDLIQVFKIVHGYDCLSFDSFFKLSDCTRTRGHCFKLQSNLCRTNIRQHFFSQRIINEWNKLPESVVKAQSVNSFKNAIDKYYNNCDLL